MTIQVDLQEFADVLQDLHSGNQRFGDTGMYQVAQLNVASIERANVPTNGDGPVTVLEDASHRADKAVCVEDDARIGAERVRKPGNIDARVECVGASAVFLVGRSMTSVPSRPAIS
jgi:hypothetical protein